jgi:hypothetical protein
MKEEMREAKGESRKPDTRPRAWLGASPFIGRFSASQGRRTLRAQ